MIEKMQITALVCCFVASTIILHSKFGGGNFIGRIFLGALFYILGTLLKGNIDKLLFTKIYLRIILVIMTFISLCTIALYNGKPTWLNFEFGQSFLLFICTSILGSLVTFVFSSLVYKKTFSVVTYLSNNTLTILGIHLLLFPLIPHINHFIGALIVLVLCIPII